MIEVSFASWSPFSFADMHRPEVRRRQVEAKGLLFLPEGGPVRRSAVVIMEGLGGLMPEREIAYGRWLADRGYVALVVDSFGARGVEGFIHARRALNVTVPMMLADAFAALAFLAEHPAVRADTITVMGFSYGGMVAVLAAYEQLRRLYLPGLDHRFAGHVSYYGCSVLRVPQSPATGAPVLIMLGERDANVSIPRIRTIADELRRGGAAVALEVFAGAYHKWDGTDLTRRLIVPSLRHCRALVAADDTIRDERSGRVIAGRLGQFLFFLGSVGLGGYHALKDEALHRRSDAMLLDFLARNAATAISGAA